jgi:hypothetical protein
MPLSRWIRGVEDGACLVLVVDVALRYLALGMVATFGSLVLMMVVVATSSIIHHIVYTVSYGLARA